MANADSTSKFKDDNVAIYPKCSNTPYTDKSSVANKLLRREASLQYRAGAIDFNKGVSFDEYPAKSCVFYLKGKIEHRTAWFNSKQRALKALEIMKVKYGQAIIYVD